MIRLVNICKPFYTPERKRCPKNGPSTIHRRVGTINHIDTLLVAENSRLLKLFVNNKHSLEETSSEQISFSYGERLFWSLMTISLRSRSYSYVMRKKDLLFSTGVRVPGCLFSFSNCMQFLYFWLLRNLVEFARRFASG